MPKRLSGPLASDGMCGDSLTFSGRAWQHNMHGFAACQPPEALPSEFVQECDPGQGLRSAGSRSSAVPSVTRTSFRRDTGIIRTCSIGRSKVPLASVGHSLVTHAELQRAGGC